MPLPIFPTEIGAPGDGDLIAIYGGGSTEVIGGIIQYAQVIEINPHPAIGAFTPTIRKGDPLLSNGVTIWLQGSLLVDIRGEPTVTDYADMLSRWDTVKAKMLLTDYELFLYYRTASPATYRKFKSVNSYLIRPTWNNPVCLSWLLAAVTTDKTLYTTAPGV
jgi:hypothetical protein